MNNIRPDFEVWEKNISELPQGYQNIKCHTIFDVKMGKKIIRKARFVADGEKTKTPTEMTYSSVMSRDSVRVLLTIAALNGLDVLACNLYNAYLTAECREQVYVVDGTKFGSKAGKNILVRNALYELKISGSEFRDFLADTLDAMVYRRTSYANPDL